MNKLCAQTLLGFVTRLHGILVTTFIKWQAPLAGESEPFILYTIWGGVGGTLKGQGRSLSFLGM